MADIRRTGQLDDFNRANESPLAAPWFTVSGWSQMDLIGNQIKGTVSPPSPSGSYYDPLSMSGDCEVWGIQTGGGSALTEGWRLGLFENPGGSKNGYLILPHEFVGGDRWQLQRYDGGSATTIGDIPFNAQQAGIVLLRIEGDRIEAWKSIDGGSTWSLVVAEWDATYRGPFKIVAGTTGTTRGWDAVGGGSNENRPQIYRWLPGLS